MVYYMVHEKRLRQSWVICMMNKSVSLSESIQWQETRVSFTLMSVGTGHQRWRKVELVLTAVYTHGWSDL